jgi:hypothetical protein
MDININGGPFEKGPAKVGGGKREGKGDEDV